MPGATPRMYIDIAGARLAPGVKDLPIGDGLLKTARVAQFKADTVRVVIDMESIREYKVFTFSDPFRIIIDVKGERRQELTRLKETIQPPPPVIHRLPGTGGPDGQHRQENDRQKHRLYDPLQLHGYASLPPRPRPAAFMTSRRIIGIDRLLVK